MEDYNTQNKTIMINKGCTRASGLSANSNDWLSRTGQSDYILNEIYHEMEWLWFR